MLSNAQDSMNLLLTAELGAYSGDEEALTVSADFAYSLADSQRPVRKFGTVLSRLTNEFARQQHKTHSLLGDRNVKNRSQPTFKDP